MIDGRGQTTLDFAIGVSVFLLAVALVFSFVPGMVQPFTDSSQEQMSASNRLADRLATDALTDGEAYVLDTVCTEVFFDESTSPSAEGLDCSYDGTADTVGEALSLGVRTDLHATLLADTDGDGSAETLCRTTAGTVAEADDVTCATVFDAGESVPESGSVVTASRRVTVDGIHAKLVVKAW